jgi:hypothetical protein
MRNEEVSIVSISPGLLVEWHLRDNRLRIFVSRGQAFHTRSIHPASFGISFFRSTFRICKSRDISRDPGPYAHLSTDFSMPSEYHSSIGTITRRSFDLLHRRCTALPCPHLHEYGCNRSSRQIIILLMISGRVSHTRRPFLMRSQVLCVGRMSPDSPGVCNNKCSSVNSAHVRTFRAISTRSPAPPRPHARVLKGLYY